MEKIMKFETEEYIKTNLKHRKMYFKYKKLI